ncbi:1-acyl-sn-glycerol-3-phosphate acyltransferase [Kribbella sp. NBC_00359]|uniref:1-acyl-sn-glycerol-3-phosphate acyltransferase n=1 Tax=Kribbella sp. NBC_00359 TaxID=2975966 RepID=UPI002E1BFD98
MSAVVSRRFVSEPRLDAVSGLEHVPVTGGCVVVANHASFLDHPLIETALHAVRGDDIYFLTKKESFSKPVSRIWHEAVGAIPVDREQLTPSTLRASAEILRSGNVLCVYPEGTRGSGDSLLPFHPGAFYIALREGVPVIPVGIAGTADLLPKGARWPRRGKARLVFGPPLDPRLDLPGTARVRAVLEEGERSVARLVDRARDRTNLRTPTVTDLVAGRIDRLRRDSKTGLSHAELRRLDTLLRLGSRDKHDFDVSLQRLRIAGHHAIAAKAPSRIVRGLRLRRRARTLVARRPSDPMANYVLGSCQATLPRFLGGDLDAALNHFREAVRQVPGDSRYLAPLAETCLRAGLRAEAEAAVRLLLAATEAGSPEEHRRPRAVALAQRLRMDAPGTHTAQDRVPVHQPRRRAAR